jgi:hypothetical protein
MTPDGSVPAPTPARGFEPPASGPIARQFQAVSSPPSSAARLSMTATLQNTFGIASDGAVKAAYGRLKAFGL